MELKRTTVLLNKGLWKEFKILAIREGKPTYVLLNEIIRNKLKGGVV